MSNFQKKVESIIVCAKIVLKTLIILTEKYVLGAIIISGVPWEDASPVLVEGVPKINVGSFSAKE